MKMKLLKAILVFIIGFSLFIGVSIVQAESYTVTAQWEQQDTTNLKEWKLFWSETSGGPYVEIMIIPYSGSGGPIYTSPASVSVNGNQGTTVTKYFVMIACGDIPVETGGTEYKCSDDSNEASYNFWVPAGQFSVPLNFQIVAE